MVFSFHCLSFCVLAILLSTGIRVFGTFDLFSLFQLQRFEVASKKKSADPFRMALSSQHSTLSQLCLPACWLLYIALHMHGLWEPRCTNKRNKNQYVADTGGIMVGYTFGAAVSSLVCSQIFLMLCSSKKGLIFKICVPFLFHFPERHAIISAVIPEAFRKMDMHWVLC